MLARRNPLTGRQRSRRSTSGRRGPPASWADGQHPSDLCPLEPSTRARYGMALLLLLTYLAWEFRMPWLTFLDLDLRDAQTYLREFVVWMHDQGLPRYQCEAALLAYQRAAWWYVGNLKPVWNLIRAWRLEEPVEPRTPVPPLVVLSLLGGALSLGLPSLALAIWLGFHCLLRPVEATSIRLHDLRLESQLTYYPELESFGVLVISSPKTRKVGPRRQHVIIYDQVLLEILSLVKRRGTRSSMLYQGGVDGFRADFAALCRALEIPSGLYTPAGLRAGGATWFWLRHQNMPALRLRGRWAVERTLEHYIAECTTFLQEHALPPLSAARVQRMAAVAATLLERFRAALSTA